MPKSKENALEQAGEQRGDNTKSNRIQQKWIWKGLLNENKELLQTYEEIERHILENF